MKTYTFYITPEQYEKAEKNGIDRKTLDNRVRGLGWDLERAMTEEKNKGRRFLPKEIIDLAAKNGIQRRTLYERVQRSGMSEIEAATKPLATLEDKKRFLEEGRPKKYSSEILAFAASNGISAATFRARVSQYGMSEYEAATKPLLKNNRWAK